MAHACLFSVEMHFRSLEFKELHPCAFDDVSKEQLTRSLKTNSMNVDRVECK